MQIRKATEKDFKVLKEIKSEFFLWECKQSKRFDPDYINRGLGIRLAKNLKQPNTVFLLRKKKIKQSDLQEQRLRRMKPV